MPKRGVRGIDLPDTGMNDILPKPFTKEGLFDMLDVRSFHPR